VTLAALSLPPRSTVLVTPVTCSGVLAAVIANDLKPKLCDVDPLSYNSSSTEIVKRLDENTSTVLVTHAAGEPASVADLKEKLASAGREDVKILEDCSQAIGASFVDGRKTGTIGDVAAFSTMYRKNLAAGASSGLTFTCQLSTHELIQRYGDRGKPIWRKDLDLRDPQYAAFPALNWNSSEISAGIGLKNLERLEETNHRRRLFIKKFIDQLSQIESPCSPYRFHQGFAPFYFPIIVNTNLLNVGVDEFARFLQAEGIPLGIRYGCLVSEWPWVKPYLADDFCPTNALSFRNSSFNLYLNENYGDQEVTDIVEAISKVYSVLKS
jgi:dTDP-4-amino-4,6-dideoxygalactose transaminase